MIWHFKRSGSAPGRTHFHLSQVLPHHDAFARLRVARRGARQAVGGKRLVGVVRVHGALLPRHARRLVHQLRGAHVWKSAR